MLYINYINLYSSNTIFVQEGLVFFELTNACNKINRPVKTGHSVITPAFNIENAKAIIHAVGPDFAVEPKAFDKLYDAYYSALVIAKEYEFHGISFPLISSGLYGGSQKIQLVNLQSSVVWHLRLLNSNMKIMKCQ